MKPHDLLKRMVRIASVLALAAGAPAFLSAALTLTPEAPVTELAPGATLNLVALRDGVAPEGALEWILHENGNLVPQNGDSLLVHAGPAGTVSFRPVVAGHSRTFTFRVRHGDQVSAPLTLRVEGAPAAAGAGAAPSPLTRLPQDAKAIVASYFLPGSSPMADKGWGCKAINREWRMAASDATHTVRTLGPITDAEFLAYTRTHPRLRRIEIPVASGLTTQGLIAGLQQAPDLEALKVVMTDSIRTDEVLAAIGPRLRELDLNTYHGHKFCTDAGLRACTRLETLNLVHGHQITGAGLPASLQSLTINACHEFDSANLPHELSHLSVDSCWKFRAFPIRTALRSLVLRGFGLLKTISSAELGTMLEGNTTLRALNVQVPDGELAFLPLPTELEELTLESAGPTRCDFTSCTKLVKLVLGSYLGDLEKAFPPSLRELELHGCTEFQGNEAFPAQLSSLNLAYCMAFAGTNLAGGISKLGIQACPQVTPTRLIEALGRMPKLLELGHDNLDESFPSVLMEACPTHPTLVRAALGYMTEEWEGDYHNRYKTVRWERSMPGSASSSSSGSSSSSSSSSSSHP